MPAVARLAAMRIGIETAAARRPAPQMRQRHAPSSFAASSRRVRQPPGLRPDPRPCAALLHGRQWPAYRTSTYATADGSGFSSSARCRNPPVGRAGLRDRRSQVANEPRPLTTGSGAARPVPCECCVRSRCVQSHRARWYPSCDRTAWWFSGRHARQSAARARGSRRSRDTR